MTGLRIDNDRHLYLRTPVLLPAARGATLYAVEWLIGEDESLVAIDVDGALGARRVLERAPAIVALTRGGVPAISVDPREVDRFAVAGWRAWITREGARNEVWARTASGNEICVWRAHATAAAPALVVTENGAWLAFHHNLREDSGEPDLIKWIAIRFVSDEGQVLEPRAPMVGRDRDALGEEQGFEFPTLVLGAGGALAIFGRGSHTYWRQDLSGAGFTARTRIGEGEWGCRGRWIAACAMPDGILTARRDKKGLAIEQLPAITGGAPELVPAQVEHAMRAHRAVPPRPRAPDPAQAAGRITLFGDIHQHSAHSDGCGSADEPYLRARHVYGDDFAALTDHESFIGKRIGPGEWAYLCAVADRHDAPGEFATLVAYEWTGRMHPGPGHKVVYLPEPGLPIVSRDEVPEGAGLLQRVRAQGGFAVPHHVGWTGADEDAHDPIAQPVWEICSCHGCYLSAGHPLGARGDLRDQMVEAVMRRGKRFGFIACSDGHGLLFHHGVARKRDPFRCGLTAVQAKARSRAAILEAIRERRCYATSGVPIYLDLRAGDAPMGSEVRASGAVRVRASAAGASALRSLALMGPDGVLASVESDAEHAELEAEVDAAWVYARVEQADGEMAWSSPIFFDPLK